jgi:hypothetical protein
VISVTGFVIRRLGGGFGVELAIGGLVITRDERMAQVVGEVVVAGGPVAAAARALGHGRAP